VPWAYQALRLFHEGVRHVDVIEALAAEAAAAVTSVTRLHLLLEP